MLARDGQVFLASAPYPSESKEEREELPQRLRRPGVAQRVPEWNRLDKGVSPVVGWSTRRHITWLD